MVLEIIDNKFKEFFFLSSSTMKALIPLMEITK